METNRYSERLEKHGINPTAIRILVLKSISGKKEIFSLLDLEAELETIDKSTLFRTLVLFQQNKVVHSIDDGSGSLKYSVCDEECDCTREWLHVHFYCTKCKRAYCLRDIHIPPVDLPTEYVTDSISYVIKGLCPECSNIANKLQ